MDLGAKLLTGAVVLLCLGLSFKAFGGDDNTIAINQVTASTNLDLSITQEGYDNRVFFSIGDIDDSSIDIYQVGNNQEIGWADDIVTWGSGAGWGGDVDYDDQDLKLWQNCTKGDD